MRWNILENEKEKKKIARLFTPAKRFQSEMSEAVNVE